MLKQTLFLILSFSIILTSACSEAYKCADDLKQKGVCRLYSTDPTTDQRIIYVKKCGKGKTCESADDETFGGCYKLKRDGLRGGEEECEVNEECFSQNCVDGKCKYIADGADCKYTENCRPTSYCSRTTRKCKPISKAGEQCVIENDSCINGYLCGGTSNHDAAPKCLQQYSIEDGKYADDEKLCKSGLIDRRADDDNRCITLTLKSSVCVTSQNNLQCTYTAANGTTVTLEGESDNYNYKSTYCHTMSNGKTKACRQLNGDLWDTYVEAYGKRLNKIKDDKDYNRHSSKWSEHLGDRDVSDAYVEWQYNVLFSDATDCVKDYFKERETSSSNFLVFNLMVIISFVLILI